ncbi:putative 2OG-Fe(II) oxygenase [Luminiphilus sp. nBUS_16]|uniref:putative 2OG-Fe(II) oxygenase n=1 Tax=Luminiphilus sp. nBUS_16 TaxID=3395315 RepID=UPI003EB7A3B5
MQMKVETLFATPLARVDLSGYITEDQVAFVDSLTMVANQTNLISENLYILDRPELQGFRAIISQCLKDYAINVMGCDQELLLTQSWALRNAEGVGMHSHAHSNSIVSGSFYYTELPTPASKMFFDRNTSYQRLELPPHPERANIFNTKINAVIPKTGELLLFPSELNHMVEQNPSPEVRSVIAFNTFIRGNIGSFRDVSELSLK